MWGRAIWSRTELVRRSDPLSAAAQCRRHLVAVQSQYDATTLRRSPHFRAGALHSFWLAVLAIWGLLTMHGLEAAAISTSDFPTSHARDTGDPINPIHAAVAVCVFIVATTPRIGHWPVRSARHLRFHRQSGRSEGASRPSLASKDPPSLFELCVLRV